MQLAEHIPCEVTHDHNCVNDMIIHQNPKEAAFGSKWASLNVRRDVRKCGQEDNAGGMGFWRVGVQKFLFLGHSEYSEFIPAKGRTCRIPYSVWTWTAVLVSGYRQLE